MMNKELKSILLKENFCCEDLEVFLNVDYKEVIKEIHKKETIYGIIIGIILLVVINVI